MSRWQRDLHALILVEDLIVPVGIAAFVWTEWKSHAPGWHMFMAWVADDWRRKGVMTRRWPQWRATYGDFTIEQPSKAMDAFIDKMTAALVKG